LRGEWVPTADPGMVHTEQVPLCETDYFRRLDLLCDTCGKALGGNYVTALGRKFHTEHFHAPICHGCSTWIIQQTIENNGEAWHSECCESSVLSV
jgi:hypothetical protein